MKIAYNHKQHPILIENIAAHVRENWGVEHLVHPLSKLAYSVTYHFDDDDEQYALVPYSIDDPDVEVEIDPQTHGELIGFRIYN